MPPVEAAAAGTVAAGTCADVTAAAKAAATPGGATAGTDAISTSVDAAVVAERAFLRGAPSLGPATAMSAAQRLPVVSAASGAAVGFSARALPALPPRRFGSGSGGAAPVSFPLCAHQLSTAGTRPYARYLIATAPLSCFATVYDPAAAQGQRVPLRELMIAAPHLAPPRAARRPRLHP